MAAFLALGMASTATCLSHQSAPRKAAQDFRGPQASGRSVCAQTPPLPSKGSGDAFEPCRVHQTQLAVKILFKRRSSKNRP